MESVAEVHTRARECGCGRRLPSLSLSVSECVCVCVYVCVYVCVCCEAVILLPSNWGADVVAARHQRGRGRGRGREQRRHIHIHTSTSHPQSDRQTALFQKISLPCCCSCGEAQLRTLHSRHMGVWRESVPTARGIGTATAAHTHTHTHTHTHSCCGCSDCGCCSCCCASSWNSISTHGMRRSVCVCPFPSPSCP